MLNRDVFCFTSRLSTAGAKSVPGATTGGVAGEGAPVGSVVLLRSRLLAGTVGAAAEGAGAGEEEARSGGAGFPDPEALPESGGASSASSTGVILSPVVSVPPFSFGAVQRSRRRQ